MEGLSTDKHEGRHTLFAGTVRIRILNVQACMQEKYVRRKTDKYTGEGHSTEADCALTG